MPERKMVILVVDDDPAVRDALKFSLELEDFQVHVCGNGEDLLAHPALQYSNCIVLDYKMPGMTGLDVLAKLAGLAISTPVIFITGPVTESIRDRAMRAGARLVLEKPMLDGILTDRIREVMV
jgi:two-component system response regulator FixJ